jgi:hypothetical protein
MINNPDTDVDPLLRPLPDAQQALIRIVGEAVLDTGAWPTYQYVEAKLDDRGYDVDAVFGGLPYITHNSLTYSLVRRDRTGREDEPVKLTIAGMAHLPWLASTVSMFIRVVQALGTRRQSATYEPGRVITVEVPGSVLIQNLDLKHERLLDLLPEILKGEPGTWHGSTTGEGESWVIQPSTFIRRFRTVTDVHDYVQRLRDWLFPAAPAQAPGPVSPLGVVTAFDYLDVVWRLRFGKKLVRLPNAERVASLVFEVSTPAEFVDRLSAVGEMIKGLDVEGTDDGTLNKLEGFLPNHLTADAMDRVKQAITALRKVTHLRNAGQHAAVADRAAKALPGLGLTFPITDYQQAWWVVQQHVVAALDVLREELYATLP